MKIIIKLKKQIRHQKKKIKEEVKEKENQNIFENHLKYFQKKIFEI